MSNLFAYGALMYDEVWTRVVSGEFRKTKAQISGYRRMAVKNEDYPGLIEGDGTVSGCIWFGLDEENLWRLDEFEGEFYERIAAVAIDETGNQVAAQFYCIKKEFHELLENHEWDLDEFNNSGLDKFISRYAGFDRTS